MTRIVAAFEGKQDNVLWFIWNLAQYFYSKIEFGAKNEAYGQCDQLMVEKVAQFSKVAQNVVKAVFT